MLKSLMPKLLAGNSRRIVPPNKQRGVAVEILPWSLYHQQTVAAIGAQTITFFRNVSGAANLLISNLTTGGLLP